MDPSWFEGPPEGWDPLNGSPLVYVQASGRFAALVAPLGACMLNGRETKGCFPVPKAVDGYDYAHGIGRTVMASGEQIPTANIGLGFPHPSPNLPHLEALDAYGDTNARIAQVRYMEHEGSVIAVGAVAAGADPNRVLAAQASALSGDWRWINELNGYRFIGSQCVNIPGYRPWQLGVPLDQRMSVRASASGDDIESYWVQAAAGDLEGAFVWEAGPVHTTAAQFDDHVKGDIFHTNTRIGRYEAKFTEHLNMSKVVVPVTLDAPPQVATRFLQHLHESLPKAGAVLVRA